VVIDAITFFNDLDMLEIRLNELDSVVDTFVIVESLEMHSSTKTKPGVLQDNWGRFKQFEKKIKYVLLPTLKPAFTDPASGWKRYNYQYNKMMDGVQASPEDVLIVSDCDEIPRATAVSKSLPLLDNGIYKLKLDMFFYTVNNSVVWDWTPSTIGKVKHYLQAKELIAVRACSGYTNAYTSSDRIISDAGWHFSFFGYIENMRLKAENYTHAYDSAIASFNVAQNNKQLLSDIIDGREIFRWDKGAGRPTYQFVKKPTDDPTLPKYFLDNVKKFEHFTDDYFKRQ
jgi:beta-1,4-mannosyl-glycoprotein beta-1,4-N-acetylglucosaminyltransferase